MAKRFSTKRLGQMIDGIIKWLGILILVFGIFSTIFSIYDNYAGVTDKRALACSRFIKNGENGSVSQFDIETYHFCKSETYIGQEHLNSNAINLTLGGIVILLFRFLGKKIINYLWTEGK